MLNTHNYKCSSAFRKRPKRAQNAKVSLQHCKFTHENCSLKCFCFGCTKFRSLLSSCVPTSIHLAAAAVKTVSLPFVGTYSFPHHPMLQQLYCISHLHTVTQLEINVRWKKEMFTAFTQLYWHRAEWKHLVDRDARAALPLLLTSVKEEEIKFKEIQPHIQVWNLTAASPLLITLLNIE